MIALRILESLGLYRPIDYNHARFDRLAAKLESPIERIFWSVAYFELAKIGRLTPQVEIGDYRVDFLYEVKGRGPFIIELDGQDYHSSPAQRGYDYKRQRSLERMGYSVIRFTGSEVYANTQQCVKEILETVAR